MAKSSYITQRNDISSHCGVSLFGGAVTLAVRAHVCTLSSLLGKTKSFLEMISRLAACHPPRLLFKDSLHVFVYGVVLLLDRFTILTRARLR